MNIQAYEPINYTSRLNIVIEEIKNAKEVYLIGYYEEIYDVFYIFNGSYEIEAAKRLQIPIVLVNCNINTMLHYDEIGFDPMLEDDKEKVIFDKRGKATVLRILEAIPDFAGEEYEERDFSFVKIITYKEFKKLKEN